MKPAHEAPAFDRISTHEELHQVLALLTESAPRLVMEAPAEPEQENTLPDEVSGLWQDTGEEQAQLQREFCRWAEILPVEPERVN